MAKRLSDADYIIFLEKENEYLRNKIKKLEEGKSVKLEKDFQETQKTIGKVLSAMINSLD